MNLNALWSDVIEEKSFLANNKKEYSAEYFIWQDDEEYCGSSTASFASDKEALAWARSLKHDGAYNILLSCEDGGMWAF